MLFTFITSKIDKRCTNGLKRVMQMDLYFDTREDATQHAMDMKKTLGRSHVVEVHETMVERTNHMTGVRYMERFDTPLSCSPSSETYWSM